MVNEYAINVTVRWWVMPLLRLIRRYGFIFNGVFSEGMVSAGVGIAGNPSVEIKYYPKETKRAEDNA